MPLDTDLLISLGDEGLAHLSSPLALRRHVLEAQDKEFRFRAHQHIISEKIRDALTGQGKRFVGVSINQQAGKSEITSVAGPEYVMELHSLGILPGGLCGLLSFEDSLPMTWSQKIRREIDGVPEAFFTRTRKDSRAASYWENEQGGGVIAAGMSGSIQGRPITYLGIDDPTKGMEQARSPSHQDKLWEHWLTFLFGRLQPWSIVLVTMARVAPDDFIGRLKSRDYEGDPDDWDFIEIPYVAGENDVLGRPVGEPLIRPQADMTVEEAYAEAVQVQKTTSTYAFQCMWQQDPRDPEGAIFPESKWRYWGGEKLKGHEDEYVPLPNNQQFEQIVMAWDMAFKDLKTSDWVVGTAWGRIGSDFYLIDLIRGRWSFTETCSRVTNFAQNIRLQFPRATTIVVEDKANGPAVIDQLRSRVGGLVEFNPSDYGSKLSRAWAIQPYLLGGNIYIPSESERPWVRLFKKEMGDFRGVGNETDDQVDATSMPILYMLKYQFAPSAIADPSDLDPLMFQTRFSSVRRGGIL